MRKISVVFLTLFASLVLYSPLAKAQQFKIGFIDLQKVLNESESGKKAKSDLESFIKSQQSRIDEKGKEIEAMKAEFSKKSSILSEDAKRKKEEELQKELRDYKRMVADAQEEAKKKETELTKEIFKEIDVLIGKLAKEEGYSAIMEKTILLYTGDAFDITEKVITKYNEMKNK